MKQQLKIGIISHNYPSSSTDRQNAGIFVHDFAGELIKEKQNVFVVCPGKRDSKLKIQKVPVYWFGWGVNKKLGQLKIWHPFMIYDLILFFIKGLQRTNQIMEETKPNINLAMWAFPAGLFAYFVKKKFGIPYAIWVLGSDVYVYARFPIVGYLIKQTLREADYLLADGIDLANKVRIISGKKCLFLPSASQFVSKPATSITKNKNKITLSFIGRMELVKGPDIFLDALIKIKDQINKFEIHMLGDGSLLKGLKEKAQTEGIFNFIKFYGNVNDKTKIAQVLAMSDWLIIPSRSDSIPLVFSESMKNGTPLIVASLPDLKYLVQKYHIGLNFKSESVEQLAQILATLPSKKSQRVSFTRNTKKVAELFSIEKSVRSFLQIIHE
ncbi:glycosyltransferase [Candidatus Microgenomates bacterium]|nr:glycosyltransferase [Candidatus Microgenomates bacterium]